MSKQPLLYDVFSGAGGCGMGYHRAGFRVVGIDIKPQPRYPFAFIQMDALEFLRRYLNGEYERAAALHASPPCQFGTQLKHIHKHRTEYSERHINLIPQTRDLLRAAGVPYVIENVPGARYELIDPVMLCGKTFGLKVYRHRFFECSFFMLVPPHMKHDDHTPRAGGGISPKGFVTVAGNGGAKYIPDDFSGTFRDYAAMAMDIDWMNRAELSQAIPPAYTEFVGRYLMNVIGAKVA